MDVVITDISLSDIERCVNKLYGTLQQERRMKKRRILVGALFNDSTPHDMDCEKGPVED